MPLILFAGGGGSEGADGAGAGGADSISGGPALSLADTGEGRLADVAPTLVDLLGLDCPREWTGKSLLVRG